MKRRQGQQEKEQNGQKVYKAQKRVEKGRARTGKKNGGKKEGKESGERKREMKEERKEGTR